jgi:hypothetical protein
LCGESICGALIIDVKHHQAQEFTSCLKLLDSPSLYIVGSSPLLISVRSVHNHLQCTIQEDDFRKTEQRSYNNLRTPSF